jgi:hypothetical protein
MSAICECLVRKLSLLLIGVPCLFQVTIEDHPHMAGKHASIHPCRHGAVMKKIIDVLVSRGGNPEVDKYVSSLLFYDVSFFCWFSPGFSS